MPAERTEIRITGEGGQGVILAARILGKAAVYDERYAVQTSSYGAEARGTAAKGDVIISERNIAFPQVRRCNILAAMSQAALQQHLKCLRQDGTLLMDPDKIKDPLRFPGKIFKIPASHTSQEELGSPLYANMVMLGALTGITKVATAEAVEKAIADYLQSQELGNNLKAFKLGLALSAKATGR